MNDRIELLADKANATLFLNISQLNHFKEVMINFTTEPLIIGLVDCMLKNNRETFEEIKKIRDESSGCKYGITDCINVQCENCLPNFCCHKSALSKG
jgi:hypothetical protein